MPMDIHIFIICVVSFRVTYSKRNLRPRGCKVKIGERFSTVRNLPYCVPQGSCARPTLYSAYGSTLQHVIEDMISLYGFSDDHSIVKDHSS